MLPVFTFSQRPERPVAPAIQILPKIGRPLSLMSRAIFSPHRQRRADQSAAASKTTSEAKFGRGVAAKTRRKNSVNGTVLCNGKHDGAPIRGS